MERSERVNRGERIEPVDRMADRPAPLAVRVALVAALVCVAALVATELAAGLFRPWNDARLAPSAALLRGLPLYLAPGEPGVVWSWLYGPIAPLVYLPAAAAGTPARAVATALVATAALVLGSMRLLLARSTRVRGAAFEAAFATLVLGTLVDPALRGAAFWVHVDAPAVALAALATAALARPVTSGSPESAASVASADPSGSSGSPDPTSAARAIAIGAVASALAVATKQVLVPLPLALGAWLVWTRGRADATRFAVIAAATGIAVAALSVAVFGARALWFNLVTIPSAHPWQWGGGAAALLRATGESALRVVPLLAILALASRAEARSGDGDRCFGCLVDRASPRGALVVVGLAMAAAGALTRVKVGAAENAHAFGVLFLSVAAAGAVVEATGRGTRAAAIGLGAALALGLAVTLPVLRGVPGLVRALPDNPETTGVALARSARGTVYFPFHPLVTLHAEERATHVSYGLYDRALAGHALGDEALRAHTAPRLERVALWATRSDPVLPRLPELRRVVPWGPQPGWQLFERETATGPPRQSP